MNIQPAGEITGEVVESAIREMGVKFGLSGSEVEQLALTVCDDRATAVGWTTALKTVHERLMDGGVNIAHQAVQQSDKRMLDEYVKKWPALDSSGNRLCLTAEQGARPGMSDADAASEISRLCLTHNQPSGKVRFNVERAVNATLAPAAPVELSAREYSEDSEMVALTGMNVDAEILRLSGGAVGRKVLDLARHTRRDEATGSFTPAPAVGHSSNPLTQDTTDNPSVSDLSQGVSLYNQSPDAPTFSPNASAELDALPAAVSAAVKSELAQAAAQASPVLASSHVYRAAQHAAAAGARNLHHEICQHAGALDRAAASYVPTPAAAGATVAGGTDYQSEIDRISALGTANSNGNRVN